MKGLFLFILTASIVLCQAQSNISKKLIGLASRASVEISVKVTDDADWRREGTGWAYKDQLTIITAKHVIQDSIMNDSGDQVITQYAKIRVKFSDDNYVDVTAHQEAKDEDISILTLDKSEIKVKHQLLHIAKVNPEVGNFTLLIGFPQWFGPMLSTGYVTSFYTREGKTRFTMSNPIIGGHSGSAVLNKYGQVIGVAVSCWRYEVSVSNAITTEKLREALKSLNIDPNK